MIECPAVMINGVITNDRQSINDSVKRGGYSNFKFIRREIFEMMEALDLWHDKMISKKPALFIFTEEQWDVARKEGIAHG